MNNIILFGGGLQAEYCVDILDRVGEYAIVGLVDSRHEIGAACMDMK